jgi:lactate dehydrogenase-like 2-hydroxyacid dehydrogenase
MKFKKLVILDKVVMTKKQEEELRQLAEDIVIHKDSPESEEEAIERAKGADAIIVGWTILGKKFFDACSGIKYVGVWATGYDHVDVRYANQKGITVTNVPGFSTESVAEFIFGQLISFLRHSKEADEHVRKGGFEFSKFAGEELQGKTLGIIGLGDIGKRVAEIAKAFNMNVVYYSRTRKLDYEKKGVKYLELNDLLKSSDIITIHTALTKQTKNLISKEEFKKMKNGVILINMARGAIVNKEALLWAAKAGKLGGIILDVYHDEPIQKDDPILRIDNSLLSPHIAFYTKQATNRKTKICVENAKSFLNGRVQNKIL